MTEAAGMSDEPLERRRGRPAARPPPRLSAVALARGVDEVGAVGARPVEPAASGRVQNRIGARLERGVARGELVGELLGIELRPVKRAA